MPFAHTLIRRVDKNAFAAIVPARPCPVLGRPIHHGVSPSITARYFSSRPSDFTSRWTLPFGCFPAVHRFSSFLGCVCRFQLRASLGFRLSAHPSQRGITPTLGYGALRERQWDSDSPDLGAAQHTLCPLLPSAVRSGRITQSGIPDGRQISRGKFDSLQPTTAGLTTGALDGSGLRRHLPTRPAPYASYPVLVHQLALLLHASFRPASRRRPCASLGLHLHQAVQGTFTLKLPNMLGTHKKGEAFPPPLEYRALADAS